MNLVILGPQGSGKDTQTEMLAEKFGLERINMGKFLREVAKQDTPLGKEIYHYQNDLGQMVPSRILKEVLGLKLGTLPREKSIIFEGVPRTMDQAEYFDRAVLESGRHIDKVIYINISEEETLKRISKRWVCKKCKRILIKGKDIKSENERCPDCGSEIMQRIDDTEDVIKKRLSVFRNETIPVIEHYKEQGKLLEINGEQAIEEVFNEILSKIQ
ncbi:MAG TPA: nucleoside monophosphate kinase [Patescibacteria group bacterium]|nr:nucleoside monophosphate kinase [Patescibacteria group bacterium]